MAGNMIKRRALGWICCSDNVYMDICWGWKSHYIRDFGRGGFARNTSSNTQSGYFKVAMITIITAAGISLEKCSVRACGRAGIPYGPGQYRTVNSQATLVLLLDTKYGRSRRSQASGGRTEAVLCSKPARPPIGSVWELCISATSESGHTPKPDTTRSIPLLLLDPSFALNCEIHLHGDQSRTVKVPRPPRSILIGGFFWWWRKGSFLFSVGDLIGVGYYYIVLIVVEFLTLYRRLEQTN
jgi:hypothetical protein